MSFTQSRTYEQDVKHCFEVSKKVLEKAGCKIGRIREFAWLIQASKTIQNREYLINMTWKPFPISQVTLSCLGSTETTSNTEKELIESIFALLDEELQNH